MFKYSNFEKIILFYREDNDKIKNRNKNTTY